MAVIEIWHNPRCTKSRQTLALLEERGLEVRVRRYLQEAPDVTELRDVLARLGLTQDMPEAELLAAMVENPILIERPVVLARGKAAIGRPPENVLDIL